jgi:hypothetical protein
MKHTTQPSRYPVVVVVDGLGSSSASAFDELESH